MERKVISNEFTVTDWNLQDAIIAIVESPAATVEFECTVIIWRVQRKGQNSLIRSPRRNIQISIIFYTKYNIESTLWSIGSAVGPFTENV